MEQILQKPVVRCSLAILCCALWGSAFPCVKRGYEMLQITNTGSQILFAGYRFFLAGLMTILMACMLEKKAPILSKSAVPYILGFGFLQTTVQYIFFYIGMAHTTGVKGSVINSSYAFVSIIVAHFLIKTERMTWQKGIGCLIGLAGVVVINLAPGAWGNGFRMEGEGMIVICTLLYGTCAVLVKFIADKGTPMAITAYQLTFGGGMLIVVGVIAGGKITGFTPSSMALLIYMALLSAVAFSLWTALLKYNPVSKITIFGFSIPIFGSLLSGIFLGEQVFSLKNLVALVLVSVGIILVNRAAPQPVKLSGE
ncbi:MAG: DMT family transporter [Lachnospiraceae bacterium]